MLRCIKEAGKDSQGSFSYLRSFDISTEYKSVLSSGDCANLC